MASKSEALEARIITNKRILSIIRLLFALAFALLFTYKREAKVTGQ